jgi:tetratricopeptide (TPR) repeat protein
MTFDDILAQVLDLLQRQGRVSYRALKRRFGIDDDYLDDLKEELIHALHVATDEEDRVLLWIGSPDAAFESASATWQREPAESPVAEPVRELLSYTPPYLAEKILTSRSVHLGPILVKGMSEPVEVYELTGASTVRRRLQAGQAYHALGNYRQAIDSLRQNVENFRGALMSERVDLSGPGSVIVDLTRLVRCLAERGELAAAIDGEEEAVRMAEMDNRPSRLIAAYFGLGIASLRKGNLQRGISVLECGLELSRVWDMPVWLTRPPQP